MNEHATGAEWDRRWNDMLAILQAFADAERVGYQLLMLETRDNHHEALVAEILPAGVDSYDPDSGRYSDGAS